VNKTLQVHIDNAKKLAYYEMEQAFMATLELTISELQEKRWMNEKLTLEFWRIFQEKQAEVIRRKSVKTNDGNG
jgi:hypothetical protein